MTQHSGERVRILITPAGGPPDWFARQLVSIRASGANYDPDGRVWVRWVDLADVEVLARAVTAAATTATEFGAVVRVETEAQVRAHNDKGHPA